MYQLPYSDLPIRSVRYFRRKFRERRQKREFHSSVLAESLRSVIKKEREKFGVRDRIFVVGNGPSLNKQDMGLLF